MSAVKVTRVPRATYPGAGAGGAACSVIARVPSVVPAGAESVVSNGSDGVAPSPPFSVSVVTVRMAPPTEPLIVSGWGSIVQFAQPSPPTPLPSSHSSPAVTMPLPHPVGVQFASQPSPLTALPSSHPSPGSSVPLPQLSHLPAAPAWTIP